MPIVDLSALIEPSPPETPEPLRTDIEFADHAAGAAQIETLMGVPKRLLRDGEGWATETFTRFGTHNSTHVDAPWHYNTHDRRRARADHRRVAARMVLRPRRGARHDRQGRRRGGDAADVEAELARIGHQLQEGDIVLVRTGRDAFYATSATWRSAPA